MPATKSIVATISTGITGAAPVSAVSGSAMVITTTAITPAAAFAVRGGAVVSRSTGMDTDTGMEEGTIAASTNTVVPTTNASGCATELARWTERKRKMTIVSTTLTLYSL